MKILIYSPNSVLIEHSFAENILIKELINCGHEVHRIFCDGVFNSFCTSMEAFSLSPESSVKRKNEICTKCKLISKSHKKIPGVQNYDTKDFFLENDKIKIDKYIDKLEFETFQFEDDNFITKDLKKKALYETILKYKIDKVSLNNESFNYYKLKLKSSLYSFFIGKNFKSFLKSDILIIYSPQYEINNFFYEGYKNKSLKTYFIEGSENLHFHYVGLRIWDWDINKLVSPLKQKWDHIKNKAIPLNQDFLVKKHIEQLYKSKSFRVFSSRKKGHVVFRTNFNVKRYKKTYLLCLSSSDEAFAAYTIDAFPKKKFKSNVFKNQLEWLEFTLDYFSKNPDFGLIVRIHPRETFEKNGVSKSQHFMKIASKLKSNHLPDNIYINYPSDNISVYDLFDIIDLTLVSWSLTAIESLLHSKPVIVYDNNLTNYPDEIICAGNSINEYELNLENSKCSKYMLDVNLNELGFKWLKANFYFNNLYFNSKGASMHLMLFLLRFSRKTNNKLIIEFTLNVLLKFIKLDKFSNQRFNNLISNKSSDLLT